MKKLIPGLAFAGLFAAVIGTSFAGPSATARSDSFATYSGATAEPSLAASYVLHLEYSDYVLHLEWSSDEPVAQSQSPASDALFDR